MSGSFLRCMMQPKYTCLPYFFIFFLSYEQTTKINCLTSKKYIFKRSDANDRSFYVQYALSYEIFRI